MFVGVSLAVLVGVAVPVTVGVKVSVEVGVWVGVEVGVAVSTPAQYVASEVRFCGLLVPLFKMKSFELSCVS